MIKQQDLETSSIDDWAKEFWDIYKKQDLSIRSLSAAWLMVVEDASSVGEYIREKNLEKALKALAHAFCWTLSFLNIIKKSEITPPKFKLLDLDINGYQITSVADVIWFKYPDFCPVCQDRQCKCPILPKHIIEELKKTREAFLDEKRKDKKDTKPTTLIGWEERLNKIYSKAHSLSTLKDVCFHYLEEVGEVAKAIRYLYNADEEEEIIERQRDLLEEIADVITWEFSVIRMIDSLLNVYKEVGTFAEDIPFSSIELNFPLILWKTYLGSKKGMVCPKCKVRPCTCPCPDIVYET